MITADAFLEPARQRGLDFYTGVPCSFLTPIINRVISDRASDYVGAANEGAAVAIAAGAWLAGRAGVVMCQNSGLGNMVNPLTSLNFPFRIPALLIVTWRGQPGLADEPQHELMGRVTPELLELLGIPHQAFPTEEPAIESVLQHALASMQERQLPSALIMRKASVRDDGLDQPPATARSGGAIHDERAGSAPVTRERALERLLSTVPDNAAIIATTGKCGRELFTLADREQHLYQVGSMGCASTMGLGVALNCRRPVYVLDGDGALLMHLGSLATIGAQAPPNLVHVVLDNGVHDSTGGQRTDAASADFAALARAAGYALASRCDDLGGLERAVERAASQRGPHFIHLRIRPGAMKNLGRPTVKPADVARRFRGFLASDP